MSWIDVSGMDFSALNKAIRNAGNDCRIRSGPGQRFLAAGKESGSVQIEGIPGNALGADPEGADLTVYGNAQDAVGDTMNAGSITVYGSVGDAVGYAMRGGEILIRDNAGYRAGIHMKEYRGKKPVLVIGGRTGSFLGEYQAGGLILVLALHRDGRPSVGNFPGTGKHGGKMMLRGDVSGIRFPEQTVRREATAEDLAEAEPYLRRYAERFGADVEFLLRSSCTVVTPGGANPYRQMYVSN